MTSLYIHPLTFNCKNNEISLEKKSIEWKKQIATVAKKKDLSAIEYLNQKYGSKIQIFKNDTVSSDLTNLTKLKKSSKPDGVVFAHFDYIEDSTIYLMYIPDIITTELIFDLRTKNIDLLGVKIIRILEEGEKHTKAIIKF